MLVQDVSMPFDIGASIKKMLNIERNGRQSRGSMVFKDISQTPKKYQVISALYTHAERNLKKKIL